MYLEHIWLLSKPRLALSTEPSLAFDGRADFALPRFSKVLLNESNNTFYLILHNFSNGCQVVATT
jgi:hypothetical protein